MLRLCDRAGLVKPGVVSIDGTRIDGNCSPDANCHFEQIAREIVEQTKATDAAEDEEHGEARGDELPEQLQTPEGRREFFRQARDQLRDEGQSELSDDPDAEVSSELTLELDATRIVARTQGREGWLREGKRQLERHRWQHPDPIPRARASRLLLAADRMDSDLEIERRANAAYEHYRSTARDKLGRRLSRPPNPYQPPSLPAGRVNVTDPDSKSLPISFGFAQGYNAQAAVNEQRIVLAAEITNTSTDFSQLDPMVTATLNELERIGHIELPEAVVADAGYWNEQHIDEVVGNKHIPVLIPPDKISRGTPRSTWSGGRYDWMRHVLATDLGRLTYRKRKQTIEPVFGHTKHNSGFTHFNRRGRLKVRTEWRLLMMTQNLNKLHRHQLAAAGA